MNRPQPTQANSAALCQAQSLRPGLPARLGARSGRRLARALGAEPRSSASSPFNRAPGANARIPQAPFARPMGKIKPTRRAPIGHALFRARSGSSASSSKKTLRARAKPNLAALERRPIGARPNMEAWLNWFGARQAETRADQNFVRPKKAPRTDFNATRRFIFAPLTIATAWRAAPKTQSACPTTAIVPNKGRHLSNGFADKSKFRSPICLRPMPIMIAAFKARRRAPPHPPHSRRAPAQQTGSIQTEWPTARRDALRSHRIVAINHKL